MQTQSQLTRREFLGATATAAVGTLCGAASALGTESFSPPIAVFSKLYQEVKLDFDQSAEITSEAGLDGIDCPVRPGGEILPEHAAEEMPKYAAALEKKKARMLLLTTGIVSPSSPHAEAILRMAKKLGIKYYRLGYWPHQAGTSSEQLQTKIKSQLKELAALNRELGVCALFQNHSAPGKSKGQAGGDLVELYEIIKDFNPEEVAVAFDFGHAIITHGEEWPRHFEKLKRHVKIAYIKDAKRGSGFVPFGQGEFASAGIFHRLKEMNYREPLSMHIEFDWAGKGNAKTRPNLLKTLIESRRTLQSWLAAA